jgi:hypothetical protein
MEGSGYNSGIGASRYPILDGDKIPFQAWRMKASAILDDADCMEIVEGKESCPDAIMKRTDLDGRTTNEEEYYYSLEEIKDYHKRVKKAAMLIAQMVSNSLAASMESIRKDPKAMWEKLHQDYDRQTPELKQLAKQRLNNFKIMKRIL